MFKIVIIGADRRAWKPSQRKEAMAWIEIIFNMFPYAEFVSGHCHLGGVDIWVETLHKKLKIKNLTLFKPLVKKWSGRGGYKSRNTEMAEYGDLIIDIEPKNHRSGGTWTLEYAEGKGKRVWRIEIQ